MRVRTGGYTDTQTHRRYGALKMQDWKMQDWISCYLVRQIPVLHF